MRRYNDISIKVYQRLTGQPRLHAEYRCLHIWFSIQRRLDVRSYCGETQDAVSRGDNYRWRFSRRQISGRTSREDQLLADLLMVRPFADAVVAVVQRPTENYLHGEHTPVPQYRFTGTFRSDWVYKSTAEAVYRELFSLQDVLWWRVHRGGR